MSETTYYLNLKNHFESQNKYEIIIYPFGIQKMVASNNHYSQSAVVEKRENIMHDNDMIEGFRLSPQQKRLWFLPRDGFTYKSQCSVLIEGKLNEVILKKALEKVVDKHQILRTSFVRIPGRKSPIQVISENRILYNKFDFTDLDIKVKLSKIADFFQEEKQITFNYEQEIVLRSSLLQLSKNQHILILNLPAILADSWSLKNIVKGISNVYDALFKGRESFDESVQYIQFSEWQNELLEEEDSESGKVYWQKQYFTKLSLPFEGKFSEYLKFIPDVYALMIESNAVANLQNIAAKYNITVAELLLTCWQIILWKITRQSDITISTVFNCRKYEVLHETLGLLAKCLPVSCAFQDNCKFTEVLLQISKTLRNHQTWQEYFLWENSTEFSGTAVDLPISFEFEEIPEKYDSGEVSFAIDKWYVCFEPFKVKLTCIQKQESLTAEFYYNQEIIDREAIQCLAEQFQTLVKSAADNLEATVSELEILSDRQRQQLLVEFNNTQVDYPQDKCIHQLFEEQVERTPNNIAVVFEDQQLTYHELNIRANKVAHYLQHLGVKSEVLVGIYMERSLDIIIAMLGILKAGGAYLPLDPALPKDAVVLRLQDVQAPILLTQNSLAEELPNTDVQLLCLDTNWEANAQVSDTNPMSEVKSDNLVYGIFTSGSTGKSKGVAIEHRQLVNYLYGILDKLNLTNESSFAIVSTFAADLGNTSIFPALCTGGCLHIVSQERASDPEALCDYFRRHPIDCLKIVPSHLAALLASSCAQIILPRQRLILGGEALSWDLIEIIQQQQPSCQILNHYGPTETTVGVLTYPVTRKRASYNSNTVPLGRPIANTQVYVLDDQQRPVPIGVTGELYIGGSGLARGYINRSELTAERFTTSHLIDIGLPTIQNSKLSKRFYKTGDLVRYLPDGNLEFLGRTDSQVKIRGFRIELEEIEALLAQHPGVQQCVVTTWEQEPENKRLVAYIVPNKKQTPNVSDLRSFLKQTLPEYMVPSNIVTLNTLPLTPNGKVDRLSLPAPDQSRPELEATFLAPQTDIEQTIATIWQDLLHVEKVGINDNFFELGGHSLLIVQVHSKLQQAFNRDISITDLFKYPTISSLTNYLNQQQSEPSNFEEIHDRVNSRLASRKQQTQTRQTTRVTKQQPGVGNE